MSAKSGSISSMHEFLLMIILSFWFWLNSSEMTKKKKKKRKNLFSKVLECWSRMPQYSFPFEADTTFVNTRLSESMWQDSCSDWQKHLMEMELP